MKCKKTDVIIVGSGISGLSTARSLGDHSYIVIEAQSQIGGRLRSIEVKNGIHWDEGAHWIHDFGDHHVFFDRWRSQQKKKSRKKDRYYQFFRKNGTQEDPIPLWEEMDVIYSRLHPEMVDSPMSDHIPIDHPFFEHSIQTNTGCMPKNASALDLALSSETGDNLVTPEGYTRFLLPNFSNISVQCNEIIQSITQTGDRVWVQSDRDLYCARAVVITVSVGVLQSNLIQFHPRLPPQKQYAINHIMMGKAERVCVVCDIIEAWIDGYFLVEIDDMIVGLECFPYEQPFISAYFAGPQNITKKLSDITLRVLQQIGYHQSIQSIHVSAWHKNPFVLGSYSAAHINHTKAREDLAQPHPPLFFAGEATIPQAYGTVHGAYQSGIRAAKEVLEWLKL